MRLTAKLVALAMVVVACSGGDVTSDASPTTTVAASPLAPSPSPSRTPSPSPSPTVAPSPSPSPSPTIGPPAPEPTPEPEPDPTTEPPPPPPPSPPKPEPVELRYRLVGSGFTAPLQVLPSPTGQTLVVEQNGRIRDLDTKAVFVDIRGRVDFGGEQGLLGAAFSGNGSRLYVHYTNTSGDTAVAVCTVTGDSASCPSPALVIDQPAGNHNGGSILWGPDGKVWLALGDGGGRDNQYGHAENTNTPLGAILRLEPNTLVAASGNPGFGDDRIVHYGLRNPFRMAFDGSTLYVADVGQNDWEEVTVVSASARGRHFGWDQWEGSHEFNCPCVRESNMEFPEVEYSNPGGGRAVIGGEVYRGSAIPSLVGHYFYSDAYSGFLKSFRWNGSKAVDQANWTDQVGTQPVHGFGHDAKGELYVAAGDKVFRIELA